MPTLFIILQYVLPQHLLSRLTGRLAECRLPWVKNPLIKAFIRKFQVDMSQAADPEPENYGSFNEFFTRPLQPDARAITTDGIASPADGAISQLGEIRAGRIFQAKGQDYSAAELLGGDAELAAIFAGGQFATIYLSPKDYHRVHMPLAGSLQRTVYIPGQLFSVNQVSAENIPRLFSRNERLVAVFDTDIGPMAMVLVGAMIVAGIETVWDGQVAPPLASPKTTRYDQLPTQVQLERGAEMGRFKLGSTVILLFPPDCINWKEELGPNCALQMGEKIGQFTAAE